MVLQGFNSYVILGCKNMKITKMRALNKIFEEKMIAGGFCPKCGDFLIPRKEGEYFDHITMQCISCGYEERVPESYIREVREGNVPNTGTLKESKNIDFEDMFRRDPMGKTFSEIIINKHYKGDYDD